MKMWQNDSRANGNCFVLNNIRMNFKEGKNVNQFVREKDLQNFSNF